MDTRFRTMVCSQCCVEKLLKWAGMVKEAEKVSILKQPQTGLIMMRIKDSANSEVFNIGEVLVTDCTVKVSDKLGYGAVLGNQANRAEASAIIDAFFNLESQNMPGVKNIIESGIMEQAEKLRIGKNIEFERVSRSRVDFETMTTVREGDDCE